MKRFILLLLCFNSLNIFGLIANECERPEYIYLHINWPEGFGSQYCFCNNKYDYSKINDFDFLLIDNKIFLDTIHYNAIKDFIVTFDTKHSIEPVINEGFKNMKKYITENLEFNFLSIINCKETKLRTLYGTNNICYFFEKLIEFFHQNNLYTIEFEEYFKDLKGLYEKY